MDFETLIADEQAGITRRLARSLGGDLATAEDLCQEVIVRAWRKLPRDAEPAAQRAWLHRTASNVTVDELRRRSRRPTVMIDEAGDLPIEEAAEPDVARDALARLTPHDRLLILLRFDAGLQHAEIAALLDITEEATRKRVARARKLFVDAYRSMRSDGPPLIMVVSHDAVTDPYVRWLERAGARVRLRAGRISERELALADGVVFAGSTNDIDSKLYGESPRALRGDIDLARDRADLAVVAAALALDIPYVGVCRGHQLLNIACGGDLYQDVMIDGAATASHDGAPHRVETLPDSTSRTVLGAATDVNSEHHQAVRRLGRRLRIAAVSSDRVVEAVEHTQRRFALGLQWHPELASSGDGGRVAEALVDAALGRAA
jgi:putative glutamine amidotransferase